MKKLFFYLFLLVFSGSLWVSCTDNDDDNDNDTYSAVYQLKNASFSYNASLGYVLSGTFNTPLYDSDQLLIYRQVDTNNNSPVWQLLPQTLYLNDIDGNGSLDELDYTFDFSKYDFYIYAGGTYDLSLTPAYLTNQTFRIVIVPGYFANKKASQTSTVDFKDYNAVIKYYNINENKIINIKAK